jgi:rhodanese-related sulfurtransferase
MTTASPTAKGANVIAEAPKKRRHGLFHKPETAEEACTRMSSSYQHQFQGSVPPLKSSEFLAKYAPADIILIDCRTRPERAISMIQGAIALEGLDIASLSTDEDKKNKTIMTYCSVGYRSGLEAEHLKDMLGKDRELYNLDGILAYTHALAAYEQDGPPLVNPDTQEATNKVHSFSKQWDVADDAYETTQFSTAESLYRMGQVASHTAVRKTQHVAHKLTCHE